MLPDHQYVKELVIKKQPSNQAVNDDWERTCNGAVVTLNDNPIDKNALPSIVKFIEDLLKDCELLSTEQQNDAKNFLNKTLHQQGLLCPISNAISLALQEKDSEGNIVGYALANNKTKVRELSFTTTKTGFKVTERITMPQLYAATEELKKLAVLDADGNKILIPDKKRWFFFTYNFALEAEAEIEVDFSNSTSATPKFTIDKYSISFGNEALERKMKPLIESENPQPSLFLQWLVDFLNWLLSSNTIENKGAEIIVKDLKDDNSPENNPPNRNTMG